MKAYIILFALALLAFLASDALPAITDDGNGFVHFGFKTENGYTRSEDIMYNNTMPPLKDEKTGLDAEKQVEYKGGYSFISADGYEYTVLYKANKKGFQPYVTARKIDPKE